jgi:tRNA A37 methylthiotransferase MiaB
MVGTRQKVLMEKDGHGHSENFARLRLGDIEAGKILDVRVTGIEGGTLIGEAA